MWGLLHAAAMAAQQQWVCEEAARQQEAFYRASMAEQARQQDQDGAVNLVRRPDGTYALPPMIASA